MTNSEWHARNSQPTTQTMSDYRHGYKEGYDDGFDAGYDACRWKMKRRNRDEEAEQARALRWYGAASSVPFDQLIPGRVGVRRYTEPDRGRTLRTWAPCCGRPIRLAPHDQDDPEQRAVCCKCSAIYRVVLIDEEDGGYGAAFIVESRDAAIALHRSP